MKEISDGKREAGGKNEEENRLKEAKKEGIEERSTEERIKYQIH